MLNKVDNISRSALCELQLPVLLLHIFTKNGTLKCAIDEVIKKTIKS